MNATPRPDDPSPAPTDELLDVGRPARRVRRWWWPAVAAVVVAGTLVWLAVRTPSPPRHRAAPAPTATPTTSPATPAATPPRSPCHGVAHCTVRSDVPPAVVALARAHLSPHVRLRAQTAVVGGRIVERDLNAYYGPATVVVRVDHSAGSTAAVAPDPPGVGSLLLHRRNRGYDVRLQYLAPETVPPKLTDLLTLMQDPRLTAR